MTELRVHNILVQCLETTIPVFIERNQSDAEGQRYPLGEVNYLGLATMSVVKKDTINLKYGYLTLR